MHCHNLTGNRSNIESSIVSPEFIGVVGNLLKILRWKLLKVDPSAKSGEIRIANGKSQVSNQFVKLYGSL